MSAFASFLGALGGPATAAAIVGAGLVVGVIGGGVVAGAGSGAGSAGASPAAGTLPVYPCPDAGPALATVQGGQRLLVTGRTADGAWLRIHLPQPGRTEGWVQATPLTVKGDITSLPVAECQPELAIASPSVEPEPSLTAIVNAPAPPTESPSASASASPTPAATPTPAPANKAPAIASLRVTTGKISYDTAKYCPQAETSVTFRVKATDDAGVAEVTLFWREPGAGSYSAATMTRTGGSAKDGTWQVTLDTKDDGITKAGKLAFYAVARDTGGKDRREPRNGADTITVAVCENTGPAITSIGSSAGGTLFWDPLSVGRCQTTTNITATVKDVDGVKSVTLFYKRPGDGSYQSKPMNNTTIKGKWYANLDTLGDKISITDPPTDNLRWYIKAVDDKGKSSQSATKTTTIRRCDSEAVFGSSSAYPSVMCPGKQTDFFASASDPDGIGASSAVLVYTYLLSDGTTATGRKRMTGSRDGPWYYSVSIVPGTDWAHVRSPFSYYIETTDLYDGVSKGGAGKASVSC